MQKYVNGLIEDILLARRPEKDMTEICKDETTIEQHFEEVEAWLRREQPDHDFSYYCGLTREQFPVARLLSSRQIKAIMRAFKKLLFSYNMSMDIPKAVPLPMAYSYLISTLERKVQIVEYGFMDFDFCSGTPEGCEWKEYCPCIKIWNEKSEQRDAK